MCVHRAVTTSWLRFISFLKKLTYLSFHQESLMIFRYVLVIIYYQAPYLFLSFQVSRISHFDYVTAEDLMGIGMGKPAARRLLDAVKKRKGTLKKKIIQTFVNQTSSKESKQLGRVFENSNPSPSNITCLIKESVSFYY